MLAEGGDEVRDSLRRQAAELQVSAELAQSAADLLVLQEERLGFGRHLLGKGRKDVRLFVIAVVDELVLERLPGDPEGDWIVTGRLGDD